MENLVKLVGLNIKEIRKAKKMTQDELAEKCGLQTSFLTGVERGDRNITIQTLEKIVIGLDESPKNIFNFENLTFNEEYYKKKEIITILINLFEDKNIEEARLILNIANEIFNTYKGK
ncbi:helix-turn-helix domain-containing protein [Ureibacillus chungkukjangi]|uniref:helix-turn-helix domain-containing protein n=1 Tax=Ureibacillus chungkukjangi TaxID=1202712 RepID=UPI00203DDE39|nr:helix-turn-helix transcriptional regulator [Ureibacillus chungkukjangi]MCM3390632.1 helix-turn-helix domain-containing protein [Ureibacillus chungkukjangi]